MAKHYINAFALNVAPGTPLWSRKRRRRESSLLPYSARLSLALEDEPPEVFLPARLDDDLGNLQSALLVAELEGVPLMRVRDAVAFQVTRSRGVARHWWFPDWAIPVRTGPSPEGVLARMAASPLVPTLLDLTASGFLATMRPRTIAATLQQGWEVLAELGADLYRPVRDSSADWWLDPGTLAQPHFWGADKRDRATWAWLAVAQIWPAMVVHWARVCAPEVVGGRLDWLDPHLPKLPDWLAAGVASAADDSTRPATASRLSDAVAGRFRPQDWVPMEAALERRRASAARLAKRKAAWDAEWLQQTAENERLDEPTLRLWVSAIHPLKRFLKLGKSALADRVLSRMIPSGDADAIVDSCRRRVYRVISGISRGRPFAVSQEVSRFPEALRAAILEFWEGQDAPRVGEEHAERPQYLPIVQAFFASTEQFLRKCNATVGLEPRTAPIPEQNTTPQAGME